MKKDQKAPEFIPEQCIVCIEEIKQKTEEMLNDLREIDKLHRATMTDEWVTFITRSEKLLFDNISSAKEKVDVMSTSAKWILSIVLSITFFIGAGFGMIWQDVVRLQEDKADKTEVITLKEAQALYDILVQNPGLISDSTKLSSNYHFLVKSILSGQFN